MDDGGVASAVSWAVQVAAPASRVRVQSVAESIWKLEWVFECVLECGNVIPCVAEGALSSGGLGLQVASEQYSRVRSIAGLVCRGQLSAWLAVALHEASRQHAAVCV